MKTMLEIARLVQAHTHVEKRYMSMCCTARRLYNESILNAYEFDAFKVFIHQHKPNKTYHKNEEFFFRPKDKRPRIKFLDRLIKQLEKENDQPIQIPS